MKRWEVLDFMGSGDEVLLTVDIFIKIGIGDGTIGTCLMNVSFAHCTATLPWHNML